MKKLFEELEQMLEAGQDAVLVTVIAGSGSTPRGAGARMIVRPDGSTMGTIGGGAVEYRAGQMALDVLREKSSFTKGFKLVKGQAADLGMICGGDVVIYFQYVGADNREFLALCRQVSQACDRDEDSWLITDITDETAWAMGLYSESQGLTGLTVEDVSSLCAVKAIQGEAGRRRFYSEPLVRAGKVFVFGGGHVAQELVPVLSHVGFRCVVFDDRAEFTSRELFPEAYERITGDFERIFEYIDIKEQDYVAVMTRGHQCDYVIQKQVLHTPACYIGVMGSRQKIRSQSEKLKAEGYTDEDIARCKSPIGLPIAAETPAEIAISIAGELIRTRALREGRDGNK